MFAGLLELIAEPDVTQEFPSALFLVTVVRASHILNPPPTISSSITGSYALKTRPSSKVKGISKGKTDIIAVSKIDDKDLSDRIAIEVTESTSPS